MKKLVHRVLALLVALSISLTVVPVKTWASQETRDKVNEAQKEKDAAEKDVKDAKKEVNSLTEKKKNLQKELDALSEELQRITDHINDLEGKIRDKEEEIRITEGELQDAKDTEANQYASMKKRIQYMYEKSDSLYVEILFSAKSFKDFLILNQYVNKLAAYDRKKLTEYTEIRHSIEALEAKLCAEKAELDGLRAEALVEQDNINTVINNTTLKVAEYKELIDDAEEELLKKEAELQQKKNDLATLKQQLAEEIRMSQLAAQSAWRDISQVQFAESDRYSLAVLIYCEAGGEPYEGQVAVGAVVINRVLSSVYPDTVMGVIRQKWQFSPVASGRFDKYLAMGKTTQSCYNAADAAMSGATNVGNCLHFRTPIPGLTGIQIGGHIFY